MDISSEVIDELNKNQLMDKKYCILCFNDFYTKKDGSNDVMHNAHPLRRGAKCCSNCNITKVIPARVEFLHKQSDKGKKRKKKYKANSHRRKIGEALDSKDLAIIKKVIRDVVGDIYRDIWLKRNSWK